MNTILLQKILDILRECLAHAGNFFKDLFVSDPQEGQVIGYDSGKWKNITLSELAVDLTDEIGPDDIITFTDAADMQLKSLVAYIDVLGGTNEVVITHTGKNLFDKTQATVGKYINSNGQEVTADSKTHSNIIKIKPSTSYYMSGYGGSGFYAILALDENMNTIPTWYGGASKTDAFVATTPANARYAILNFNSDQIDTVILAESETPVAYESYNGTTETVTLPSSIANGYVDVISGAGMDVDTSTTFSVTPVIIKSTTGINNIWADSGTVSAEYYTKTAGNIRSLVSISEDITDQVTVNTDNFSDVHVKVMKNNNVITIYLNSATAILGGQLLTGLPAPAYNMNIVVNDGSDGSPVGATLQTQGRLNVSAAASQTVNALITYVAK